MTNDESVVRQRVVDSIVKGVVHKTVVILSLAIAVVLLFTLIGSIQQPWWFLTASVLFGGALGLLNFRWLAIAVQRI